MLDTFTKALTSNPNVTVAFGLDHDYILDSVIDKDDLEIINIDHESSSYCFLASLDYEKKDP